LLIDSEAKWPVSWSSDGKYILYVTSGQTPGNHIMVLPLSGDRKPFPFMRTEASENWASFSPDGKWVAYSSTESGAADLYIAPFPPVTPARRYLVSKGGGTQTRWRRDGKELYYVTSNRTITAASVDVHGSALEIGAPQPLFEVRFPYGQYHSF